MNIGIFGGAFNPVHNGHLFLMEHLTRTNQIDKLIVIPTANPPHKTNENLADAEHRINMLHLALENKENFDVDITENIIISDIEFKLKGKSYTYNTLCQIKKIYPEDDLFLFMGSDQLLSFKKWYRYKDILKMASVVGFIRENDEQAIIKRFLQDNAEEFFYNVGAVVTKPVVVSSTDIRNRVKLGESISDLVPEEVEKYIKDNGLYV